MEFLIVVLTPKGLKNLLVAGRCISTDEEAFEACG